MENEELIRQRMERTRESLTEKIETLECKVMNSVQEATSSVKETVANVKDAVDVKAHVDRHPWLMFSGSILAGYVLANLLDGGKRAPPEALRPAPPPPKPQRVPGNGRHSSEKPQAPATSSWLAPIEPEINHLKGLALGVALGTVREMVTEEVPPHMAEQLRTIIDDVTRKIGGEPVPSSDFAASKSALSACVAAAEGARFDTEKPRW